MPLGLTNPLPCQHRIFSRPISVKQSLNFTNAPHIQNTNAIFYLSWEFGEWQTYVPEICNIVFRDLCTSTAAINLWRSEIQDGREYCRMAWTLRLLRWCSFLRSCVSEAVQDNVGEMLFLRLEFHFFLRVELSKVCSAVSELSHKEQHCHQMCWLHFPVDVSQTPFLSSYRT